MLTPIGNPTFSETISVISLFTNMRYYRGFYHPHSVQWETTMVLICIFFSLDLLLFIQGSIFCMVLTNFLNVLFLLDCFILIDSRKIFIYQHSNVFLFIYVACDFLCTLLMMCFYKQAFLILIESILLIYSFMICAFYVLFRKFFPIASHEYGIKLCLFRSKRLCFQSTCSCEGHQNTDNLQGDSSKKNNERNTLF